MKAAAEIIKNLDAKSIAALERDGHLSFDLNGTPAEVELSDVEIISEDIPGWLVANEGSLTIALDVTVTPELRREGIARDIVNRIRTSARPATTTSQTASASSSLPEPTPTMPSVTSPTTFRVRCSPPLSKSFRSPTLPKALRNSRWTT